jgi:hypothetical protein
VTEVLSVAVNDEMETVNDEDVDGMVKRVITGLVVSVSTANVAEIVWLAVMLEKVYELGVPTETLSTKTLLI